MNRICTSQFLLSSFSSTHFSYQHKEISVAKNGKQNTRIGYIEKGSVVIKASGGEICAGPGDILYLPGGVKYTTVWTGTPNIEFFSVDFYFNHPEEIRPDQDFCLQMIEKDNSEDIGNIIRKIYEYYEKDDEQRFLSLSNFYILWSKMLSKLRAKEKPAFSPAIAKALEFIHSEYLTNFSVSDIAGYCHLSESRLYHRFREEMHCSPIHYRNDLRIKKAIEYLEDGNYTMTEISNKLNFNSHIYFRRIFRQITGFSPMEYKKRFLGK